MQKNYRIQHIFITFLLFLSSLTISPTKVKAIYDPLITPNNKIGIHIVDENDLSDAKNLVNQNGDWGYITLVIQKTDRNTLKWQKIFDQARRFHLIPIVRIATRPQAETWEKPSSDEIDGWVSFLNSLNWVIENRYVVIGNEPNHAKEWGGEINPQEYALYLKTFAKKLKIASNDFFVLPAGLDASAKTQPGTLDEQEFLTKMVTSNPDVFDNIDGWASHSYPNPDFSGSPTDEGRGSLRTYQWELDLLKELKINKNLPIFITETGWSRVKLSEETLSNYYEYAIASVWSDPRIAAVTPFILNYIDVPFKDFSWKKPDGGFYKFFDTVKNSEKVKGKPIQTDKALILISIIPQEKLTEGFFPFTLVALNKGQTIWETKNINIVGNGIQKIPIKGSVPEVVEPGHFAIWAGIGQIQNFAKYLNNFLYLEENGKQISNQFYFSILMPNSSPNPLNLIIEYLTRVLTKGI